MTDVELRGMEIEATLQMYATTENVAKGKARRKMLSKYVPDDADADCTVDVREIWDGRYTADVTATITSVERVVDL